MKIRKKLFLGFGLYIILATILGFLAYKELQIITTRLTVVEIADDITNTILEVRRYEKNFLLYKDREDFHELKKYLAALKKNIDNIRTEIINEFGTDNYNMMKESIAEYEYLFDRIAENLRAHEGLYKNEKDSIDKMRLKAREIQSFTENLLKRERETINSLLKSSVRLLLFAILIIMVLGTVINIKLGASIAAPIRSLEEATRKVAKGDFSQRLNLKGKDEIASLGASFNQMEERLQETMSSLELAVERLHEKQAQLIETEKLATLGKFAAGVAHEINNPLAIINEKAGLMKDIIELSHDFPNKDKFLNLLNAVFDNVNRCSVITHRILGFARKADITPELIDINSLLGNVIKFLEQDIMLKGISLKLDMEKAIPPLRSDRIQLEQVFLNIIKNAIDAVEDGGIVRISTDIKDNNTIQVAVQDNGHGISKEILRHIFEPFFTTKEKSKGTGLGLSIAYGIVRRIGGNIVVESEVNKGTTFTVEIPLQTELHGGENI